MTLTLITPAPVLRCLPISEGMVVAVGPGGRTADGDVIPMAVQVGHPGDARVVEHDAEGAHLVGLITESDLLRAAYG